MAEKVYMVSDTNCTTGEEIVRPMTAEEIAVAEANLASMLARKAEAEAEIARIDALKTSAKTKLIAGQPLTEEEASVLVI